MRPQRPKGMKFILSFSWKRSRSRPIGHGNTQDGPLSMSKLLYGTFRSKREATMRQHKNRMESVAA